jgi:hypothetical protein
MTIHREDPRLPADMCLGPVDLDDVKRQVLRAQKRKEERRLQSKRRTKELRAQGTVSLPELAVAEEVEEDIQTAEVPFRTMSSIRDDERKATVRSELEAWQKKRSRRRVGGPRLAEKLESVVEGVEQAAASRRPSKSAEGTREGSSNSGQQPKPQQLMMASPHFVSKMSSAEVSLGLPIRQPHIRFFCTFSRF